MVRKSMMQAVTIDPAHWIDVDADGVVDQRQSFDEPFLVVQRAVRDAHVHHVGQIDPGQKPGREQIAEPDRHAPPWPDRVRRKPRRQHQLKPQRGISEGVVDCHGSDVPNARNEVNDLDSSRLIETQ